MVLQYPPGQVASARHQRPVVIVHGTLVDKQSIAAYRDYALETGHPVDWRTYKSVQDGDHIDESARQVSHNVNAARREIGQANLKSLHEGADLAEFFQVDDSPRGRKVSEQLPWLLQQAELALNGEVEHLSSRLAGLEEKLARRLGGQEWCRRAADHLVDALAPKATLVGHSAGGFVAYTVAVNPDSYDGGQGVGDVVVLSSPIGKGMSFPAPPGLAEMPFYQLDRNLLRPLEQTPAMQLARLNPFFDFSYAVGKSMAKTGYAVATQVATAATCPLIYALKPGYEEVAPFASFFREKVQGKPVPEGVTVVAVTSEHDKMSLPDRSRVDDRQANAHNFAADLQLSEEELARERPTWGHVQMSTRPALFKQQFVEQVRTDPAQACRYLDPANDDGCRYEVLQALRGQKLDPAVRRAVEKVAGENQPFADSPSALARELLKNPR